MSKERQTHEKSRKRKKGKGSLQQMRPAGLGARLPVHLLLVWGFHFILFFVAFVVRLLRFFFPFLKNFVVVPFPSFSGLSIPHAPSTDLRDPEDGDEERRQKETGGEGGGEDWSSQDAE